MDEMKIKKSGFFADIAEFIIKKMIKKHLGCDIDISIQEITVLSNDDKTHVHMCIDGVMTKEVRKKLLNSLYGK